MKLCTQPAAFAALCALVTFALANAAADPLSRRDSGSLSVTVKRAGQTLANAAVCAGTPQNPAQYGHKKTNASGVASFGDLPRGAVAITAQQGSTGVSQVRKRNHFGAYVQNMTLMLPIAPGGPLCASTPLSGGPEEPTGPTFTPPARINPPSARLTLHETPGPISPKIEYCFGALGAQCGGAQVNLPALALCANGHCQINAGSWRHDECCFSNSRGMACTAGPLDSITGHNGGCVAEWNTALSRLSQGLNWTRTIDFNRPNRTGRVEFSAYCAPAGTRVHQDDVRYCCTRRADPIPHGLVTRIAGINYAELRQCR